MKKHLRTLALGGALLVAANATAQTPVGTLVNNFTLTDINGNTQDLYSYLDAGKMVVIDVSAAWCGPCWSYHGTNALDNFYAAHGPAGANDAMVLWVEGDPSTGGDCLTGPGACTGSTSQGDWTNGGTVAYPIIDLATSSSFTSSGLSIPYFPVMYVICPNRTVIVSGVAGSVGTLSNLNSYVGDCSTAAAGNNAALHSYTGETEFCGTSDVKFILQNMGTTTLTSCSITATIGATTLGPLAWTGSLATYDYEEVNLGSVTLTGTATANITITTSDLVSSDNTLSKSLAYNFAPSANITVQINTDRYGDETTWTLKNSGGTTVGSGGPYTLQAANGVYPQTPANYTLPTDCYTFKINDSYGDGMNAGYGAGSYVVKYGTTTIVTGGVFTTTESRKFANDASIGVNELEALAGVQVFPNPVSGLATVSVEMPEVGDITVNISNSLGQVLASQKQYNAAAGTNRIDVDFSAFESGVYYVNVTVGNKSTIAKIIK
ncbi:MAG TPA: T9SS type A sorting domain-containing protein [Flavobacteriales bacterium]|nr:T9SS type A sorting domain-containing protein [Flavobacteriales bacterium]